MNGVLIINKPSGPTSHDVVSEVKKLLGAKKVGHLGTLDPAASGVLPLVINRATKLASQLGGDAKVYEFDLVLGRKTDTDDDQGRVVGETKVPADAEKRLKEIISGFVGEISQVPPAYSAVKINGRPLYKSARRGKPIVVDARRVKVHALTICHCERSPVQSEAFTGRSEAISVDSWDCHALPYGRARNDLLSIRMRMWCSSGTYVRALCRDIGEAIGSCGHAANIRRLQSGPYKIEEAISLEAFTKLSLPERLKRIKSLTPTPIFT